jgi:Trk K+ transport system NAD-binding subunit
MKAKQYAIIGMGRFGSSVALKAGEKMNIAPYAEHKIKENDILVVVGATKACSSSNVRSRSS